MGFFFTGVSAQVPPSGTLKSRESRAAQIIISERMSWGDSDIFFSTCTLDKITRPFQLLYLTNNNLQKDISTQVPSLKLSPHVSTRILKLKRFLV